MKLGIAADHAGFALKQPMVEHLRAEGHEVIDYGARRFDAQDDYPDVVLPLAQALARGEVERGIALCGSGVGVSIAANKIAGVRAALISDTYSARQGVEHDAMNLLCLGGRVIGPMLIKELVHAFLHASFQPQERFQRRLEKVIALEQKK